MKPLFNFNFVHHIVLLNEKRNTYSEFGYDAEIG